MLSKMTFPAGTSKAERISAIAPMLNKAIDELDEGELCKSMGVETFDDELLDILFEAGLLDKQRVYQIDRVCIHPDNREKDMMVPSGMHELLDRMVEDGFSWKNGKHSHAPFLPTRLDRPG